MEALRVTYELSVPESEAAARAQAVALEQTVEVPRAVVRDAFVEREVMGAVERVRPAPGGGQLATVAYPVAVTGLDPARPTRFMDFGDPRRAERLVRTEFGGDAKWLVALRGFEPRSDG